VAPAPLDADGRPSDFSSMGEQMRVCYANIAKLLALYGAGLEDVVEETLYVLDMDAAFAVVGKVRKAAYGSDRPQAASNIIGVSRLAQRPQLIEIVCRAVIGAPAS
jgi:enamine deaminase RidA (YjgF/YER057c/UK114 family)